MNVSGVAEFFFRGRGRGRLRELAETRAGVGKAPGGQLDAERVQRFENVFVLFGGHSQWLLNEMSRRYGMLSGNSIGVKGFPARLARSALQNTIHRTHGGLGVGRDRPGDDVSYCKTEFFWAKWDSCQVQTTIATWSSRLSTPRKCWARSPDRATCCGCATWSGAPA